MGTKPTGPPNDFSLEITGYITELIGPLSTRQAADKIDGMSHTYLAQRLRGEKPFNTNDIAKVAKAFGVSPFDIVRLTPNVGAEDDTAVLGNVTQLSRRESGETLLGKAARRKKRDETDDEHAELDE